MANDRFDKEAAEWDNNPVTVKSSKLAFGSLLEHVPELADERRAKELDVLEIGCGTGLLTLQVAPRVRSLTAVDTSSGMIKALQAKIDAGSFTNIHPLCLLLEDAEDPALRGKKFDLIISHLVLHHIPSLDDIITLMYKCLKPNGRIALTDFERFGPESRKFHPDSKMEGVQRHGITKIEMECAMHEAGFDKVQVCQAFRLEKSVEGGGSMEFPFLICMGVRR
ncbi:uncharacterized protein PV09_08280 [Verruconis gallopava]|uniref:Methyltransferase type 11 domain-containing protein n=1 Tax=Verruconis gallopava TaxID=253628 RepID=A0A0D2ALV2_9PEZI|nr:uncharacterized protein PV09_08280 [Verruconis gallopava]KIW00094.1 hypothetical protein PV09_08280 [Verruconis gallopava]